MTEQELDRLEKGHMLLQNAHYDAETVKKLEELTEKKGLTLMDIVNILYDRGRHGGLGGFSDYRPTILLSEVAQFTLAKCINVYKSQVEKSQKEFEEL